MQNSCSEGKQLEEDEVLNILEPKEAPKWEHLLWSLPKSLGEASPSGIHWV